MATWAAPAAIALAASIGLAPAAPDDTVYDIVAPIEDIVAVYEEIDNAATTATAADGQEIRLAADVNFDKDSAALTARAGEILSAATSQWKERTIETISVVGHTDSVQGAVDNQQLSNDRAAAVAAALKDALGEVTITAAGKGATVPIAKESGSAEEVEAARALNRRVDILVTFADEAP